jgi:DNA repair protein RecO (recombination protein O)
MKRGCAVLATSKGQSKTRIADEPAFVLHRYDWSESSLVLDVFTRHHGRVALVAKGAKRPHSNLRAVLMPLQPLLLNFTGEQEVRTLTAAHWLGGHVFPRGDSLLAGFYLNELILKLMAREDAHEHLFDLYAQVVKILASGLEPTLWPLMRAFELLILKGLGLLPSLDAQSANLKPLDAKELYTLIAPMGLMSLEGQRMEALAWGGDMPLLGAPWTKSHQPMSQIEGAMNPVAPKTKTALKSGLSTTQTSQTFQAFQAAPAVQPNRGEGGALETEETVETAQTGSKFSPMGAVGAVYGLSGELWHALGSALNGSQALTQTLRVCAQLEPSERSSLQSQLRAWLTHHCGGVGLKTRQFMVDIHAL